LFTKSCQASLKFSENRLSDHVTFLKVIKELLPELMCDVCYRCSLNALNS